MSHIASEIIAGRLRVENFASEVAVELARHLREPHKTRVLGGAIEAASQVVTGVTAVTTMVRQLGEANADA